MQKWEDYLRKGAFVVGTLLEQAIEKAGEIASSIGRSASSVQPVLSLEGQLSVSKLKELINKVADKMISASIPNLVDKTSLEIREGASSLTAAFKERGASLTLHADMSGGGGSYGPPSDSTSVRSLTSRLPFEDGFFDYVAGLYANQYQGDILKTIKEFSRVLTISGEGVIVDFHPFGMYAKRGNVRLKPAASTIRGVEDYYKICKASALRIVDLKESFLDETARSLFISDAEKQAFQIVKQTPLLIYLFVKKGG